MSINDILKMIRNVNKEDVLQAFKSLNYSNFSSEDLVEIKKILINFLDGSKPKLNIKCWSDFINLGIIFIVSLMVPFFKMIMMIYGALVLLNVGIQMRRYFKIKSKYYSEDGIMQVARDALSSINDILAFRKKKSEAINLDEVNCQIDDREVNYNLDYLYKLIECVNASLINLSGDYKVYVNLRFNDALKSLDSIDNQESLDIVIAEFERIADIITEAQQEEQNLQNSETLKGEARS